MDLSPAERLALEYCAPHGIPLSVFLGARVYNGDPQWTDKDRFAALEWLARSGCGHDPAAIGDTDKWNAEIVGYCDACKAVHRTASVAAGRDDLDPLVGARYRVWRDEEATGGDVTVGG